ncbi:hypothetical protein [Leptospira kobayashii]|nr:hypothetical protein [Leptospira kobayashii]
MNPIDSNYLRKDRLGNKPEVIRINQQITKEKHPEVDAKLPFTLLQS